MYPKKAGILAGAPEAAKGEGTEEGHLLKGGNGVCREVKGRDLGFLVVEEFPLEAFAESHSPWLWQKEEGKVIKNIHYSWGTGRPT